MRTIALTLALACAGVIAAPPAHADEPTLTVGDKAPPIDIAHWIKGVELDKRGAFEPLTTFQEGQLYLLEFWATWCGPCVGSMPHLSELQARHADDRLTVIGVSDESLPKVIEFLLATDARDGRTQHERTAYTLATDPDGSVKQAYFRAAGQRGIPCGFLVGITGHIEWIGDPRKVDDVIVQVLAGTWDRQAYRAVFEEERRVKAIARDFMRKYREARGAQDWEACLALLDQNDSLGSQRARGLEMERFQILLVNLGRQDEAYAALRTYIDASKDDPRTLNQIAWTLVDQEGLPHRDLALALSTAERANELAEGKDAPTLDTLARIHHDRGDLQLAIEWQRKAAAAVEGKAGAMPDGIREILGSYEAELAAEQAAGIRNPAPSDG